MSKKNTGKREHYRSKSKHNKPNIFMGPVLMVQPTLSEKLNSELTHCEMGNSNFSVSEQLKRVSSVNYE